MKLRGLDRRTINSAVDKMAVRRRMEASKLTVPEVMKHDIDRAVRHDAIADRVSLFADLRGRLARKRSRVADSDTQAMVLTAIRARRQRGLPAYDVDARGRAFVPIADLRDGQRGETRRVYVNRELHEFPARRTRRARARAGTGLSGHHELMRRHFKGIVSRPAAARIVGIYKP